MREWGYSEEVEQNQLVKTKQNRTMSKWGADVSQAAGLLLSQHGLGAGIWGCLRRKTVISTWQGPSCPGTYPEAGSTCQIAGAK